MRTKNESTSSVSGHEHASTTPGGPWKILDVFSRRQSDSRSAFTIRPSLEPRGDELRHILPSNVRVSYLFSSCQAF